MVDRKSTVAPLTMVADIYVYTVSTLIPARKALEATRGKLSRCETAIPWV